MVEAMPGQCIANLRDESAIEKESKRWCCPGPPDPEPTDVRTGPFVCQNLFFTSHRANKDCDHKTPIFLCR